MLTLQMRKTGKNSCQTFWKSMIWKLMSGYKNNDLKFDDPLLLTHTRQQCWKQYCVYDRSTFEPNFFYCESSLTLKFLINIYFWLVFRSSCHMFHIFYTTQHKILVSNLISMLDINSNVMNLFLIVLNIIKWNSCLLVHVAMRTCIAAKKKLELGLSEIFCNPT